MFYEVISKRIIIDAKGNDKEIAEKFIINNCEFCQEAEKVMLLEYNGENRCTSIKESNLREFVNKRQDDDQAIFLATLEDVFITDDGDEKATRYVVGLFANTVEEATKIMIEYMKQGLSNLYLVSIKKTKIVDLLKV
jgi:hypothetical protein